jgi:hypothetical protein
VQNSCRQYSSLLLSNSIFELLECLVMGFFLLLQIKSDYYLQLVSLPHFSFSCTNCEIHTVSQTLDLWFVLGG